jgi:hypothetical protein
MQIHHHHHYHPHDPAIEQKLDRILQLLTTNGDKIMAVLDQLTTDVTAETTIDQSAITLINGLAAQIKAAGTDPVALKALTDQMEANATALSAAVAANTQQAPAPAPAPTPGQ